MTDSATIILETEQMYFRQFRAADAQLLFELDSDPEVMRFITKGRATPMERIQNEIIPRFLDYYKQSPPRGFWAAHLRETGEFIGWFHLRPDKDLPNEMELGYRLSRNVWGRGLATEGSHVLIERAFGEWGYQKISAHTMATNLASRRVMEKSGLTLEREFQYEVDLLHGWVAEEERRAVKYSITHTEFSQRLTTPR